MARSFILTLILLLALASAAGAETLTFENVLSEAISQSYDLKLADLDVRFSQNEVLARRADYLPRLLTRISSERLKDLTSGQSPVAVVGDSTIPNVTRYQNLLYLGFSHTVFDFGYRGKVLHAAKHHRDASRYSVQQRLRDFKIQLIDLYAKALISYNTLRAKEKALSIHRELYQMKRRLHLAGKIWKVDVAEEALQLARTVDEMVEAKETLVEDLKAITAQTHTSYDVEHVEVTPFPDESLAQPALLAVEDTPDYNFYKFEIQRKRSELKALQRQMLPQIGIYSNFYVYGFDQDDYIRAFKDLRARTIAFGLSMTWSPFDSVKNMIEQQKKRLEIQRLGIERDKRLWELKEQHEKNVQMLAMYEVQLEKRQDVVKQGNEKLTMVVRLSDRQVTDRTTLLTQKLQLIDRDLELEKTRVQHVASFKRLKVLSQG